MQKSLKCGLFFLWGIFRLYAYEDEIDPVIYHNKYGFYFLLKNHDNRPVIRAIKRGKVYEEKTLSYIAQVYQPGTDIIHAGAYIGDMLPFFSSLVGANHVWAFEPIKLSFLCAEKNVHLNHLENVFLFNFGLSNRFSDCFMKIEEGGKSLGGSSWIIENESLTEGVELVEVRPLDNSLKGKCARIGILHLDVEGHEIVALKGSMEMICQDKPVIILECWKSKENEIAIFMDQIGYFFVKKVDNNAVYKSVCN